MAASASSIRGSSSAIRPRTPEGTSTAAYLSPLFGSSGVTFIGGLSIPTSLIFWRMTRISVSGSWPNRATKSANIRLFDGYTRILTIHILFRPVSYTHLRAHETRHDLVCRLLLEKKKRLLQL